MIEVNNITFSYPGTRRNIFRDFSLTLNKNNIYGLLGKNGTGKSTLLYLLSGMLRANRGEIKINGVDARIRRPDVMSEIFMVPEEFDLPPVSLDTYVKTNSKFYPRFNNEVLANCLKDFELSLSINLNELSMGQKKKVFMSFALAAGTSLLLMDEPTNGLDIPSKSQFRRVMANNMSDDRILIISTHQVHDVESLLDHILILSESNMMLNASTSEICKNYRFEFRSPSEMDNSVIYAEPTLQGNAVIAGREAGSPETQINLELLFNAVVKGIIR
ncbi:ABC transporter ATP-binding protein [Xylanibacter muris]|uniref:ATP-binding cassette domain-containing protein n=1 Tax=Xylanibacter muris TaxID=2736290 RepID=A0ABX2AL46_9BACT|nr:ATP-binding cassette domain-containing protein [Xylanibacter muris]NPD91913.1 ATP-binding cassette domain-containing protein [Xylanibacter muris]